MGETKEHKALSKGRLKKLREERKETLEAARSQVKEQNRILKAIRSQLKEAPRTVPEIAAAVGISPSDGMWYVASMKKYGEVAEGEKDGAYFRYTLVEGAGEGGEA